MDTLNNKDWRRLIQTIQQDQCVLLLGPGVARNDSGQPLSFGLANALAKELGEETTVPDRDNLAQVAQLYHQQEKDHLILALEAKEFYTPHLERTSDLHRLLAKLPFTLCIQTTIDRMLANAFVQTGKDPIEEYYNWQKPHSVVLEEPTTERPVVYHLYGSLGDMDSLVLTENDLLDFLVKVIKDLSTLPSYITGRFKDPKTSFLFIGFGFRNWYIRILLHLLRTQIPHSRSLALEDNAFFAQPELHQTLLFFEQHLIEFKDLSWFEFAATLNQHWRQRTPAPKESANPAADAPTVFLCHSSIDKDRIAEIEQQLKQQGINTWLDRQQLRGGDNWERQLPQVIQKQVDYVAVFQSAEMAKMVESYFYKEIDVALTRQSKFRRGTRFLIPVLLESIEGIDYLNEFQQIDLSDDGGIEALAETIKDDWQRRKSAIDTP